MVKFKMIPLNKADMSEQNVRKIEEDIQTLADSIRVVDVIEPVVAIKKADRYEIVIGQRRTVAALKAGKDQIPALVYRASEYDPSHWKAMSIVENVERASLRDSDIEVAVRELVKELGSPKSAAKALGWGEGRVRKWMRIEGLPDEVKRLMGQGLTTEDARRLTDLIDKRPAAEIIELAKELANIKDRKQRTQLVKVAKQPGIPMKTLKTKAAVANRQRKLILLIDKAMMEGLTRAAEDLHASDAEEAAEKILDVWLGDHKYYSPS